MKRLKPLGVMACAFALCATLAACGGSDQSSSSAGKSQPTSQGSTAQESAAPVEQPADLDGKWTQTNANSDGMRMDAEIAGGTITVNWVQPDSTSLYWVGSYEAPTAAGDWSWTSKGDTEKMASALLASQDETKEFHYTAASDEISFQASAMGTTVTVRMQRQQS
ncbi:hypothetical protein PG2006B_1125 [Bifidobacterium animalis subsp. animalis]|uniref:hypothetical protein n=1 Tax=Bifidobacterium animalis TaxID=28025 RepID=UPI0010D5A925|nr:hypothetical protein [Bifidobacterium animalis]RYN12659.1 hypothetical protein PG2006B_1125 [Bifidobacterium animalis subsp. animalis]